MKFFHIGFYCLLFVCVAQKLWCSLQDTMQVYERTPLTLQLAHDRDQERVAANVESRAYRPSLLSGTLSFYDFAGPQSGIGCLTAIAEIKQCCYRPTNCFVETHCALVFAVCCIKVACCCPC